MLKVNIQAFVDRDSFKVGKPDISKSGVSVYIGVRQRHVCFRNRLSNRIHRDLVVGIRQAGVRAHELRCRQQGREISVLLGGRQHIGSSCGLFDRSQTLVADKEESTVLDDGSAELMDKRIVGWLSL